jgi:hypothetical protein
VRKLLNEPLVHFLAIGGVLFLVGSWGGDSAGSSSTRIVVSTAQVEHLAAAFSRTWQRSPSTIELEGLVDDFIREEVLYREAIAMGLDRDDTIIRRRLRQKVEFITDDMSAQTVPSEKDLEAYLHDHGASYRSEPRIAFRQVFLNLEKRQGRAADDARMLLARLQTHDPGVELARFGDRIMLPERLELSPRSDVARQFGDGFARVILQLPVGRWAGPVESGYGLHLVFVIERLDGATPALAEVRAAVERDWFAARRKALNDAMYRKLRSRYTVTVEQPTSRERAPELKAF